MIADRYELIEQIGTGGMATVWRATDTLLGRSVAVKRLLPHLALDPQAAERFKREAQAAAGLSHPGIVTVFDTGEDDDGPFMILELIEGETLAARLASVGPLAPALVIDIVSQVGSALDHAHGLGVVHRDIKPANLILEPDGRVRLADFGIARTVDDPTSITATGELVGTISYMAPELLEGASPGPASDVYSLAAITYEMLAGTPPFSAETPAATIEAVRRAEPASLAGRVPDEMAAAVTAGMSRDLSRRPPSAGMFASGLVGAATLVLGQGGAAAGLSSQSAAPGSFLGSEDPTVVTSRQPPPPPPSAAEPVLAKGGRSRWPLLLVLLGVLALAAAAMTNDLSPTGSAGTLDDLEAAEDPTTMPTTTTTVPTTTTTVLPTTTTIPTTTTVVDNPETVAVEVEALLASLQPPQFSPRDVRRIEDRLDRVMEEWENDDRDDLMRELERAFEAVADLEQSADRDQLNQLFIQLAELMGFEVDQGGQGGDDDD